MSTFEYGPLDHYSSPLDPERCRAAVYDRTLHWPRGQQCSRKAVVEGKWCKQHDPDRVERKRVEREAAWRAQWERDKRAAKRTDVIRHAGVRAIELLREFAANKYVPDAAFAEARRFVRKLDEELKQCE